MSEGKNVLNTFAVFWALYIGEWGMRFGSLPGGASVTSQSVVLGTAHELYSNLFKTEGVNMENMNPLLENLQCILPCEIE